jgi:threonine dehydrogenase-like Zn-dependent dehydrogenase
MSQFGTAKAVVFRGTERGFDVIEQPVPDPEPGRVLLRTALGGICGTDVHMFETGLPKPMALGHEIAGTVVAIGGDEPMKDFTGRPIADGDLIVPHPGTPNGAYGFRSDPLSGPPYLTGGFGQYIALGYAGTNLFKVEAPPEVAVLLEPLSIGVHSVERSRLQLGDTVVVQGTGAIGLLTIYVAKQAGAARVIAVGGPKGRLAMATELGADTVIDIAEMPDPAERVELVKSLTPNGAGADVVYECAGVKPAIVEGIDYLRRSGTFCEAGHFIDTGDIVLNPNRHLVLKDITLVAPYGSHTSHFVKARALLERDASRLQRLVSHRLPLERVQEGFDALLGRYHLDGRDAIKIAIDPWQS